VRCGGAPSGRSVVPPQFVRYNRFNSSTWGPSFSPAGRAQEDPTGRNEEWDHRAGSNH